MPSCLDNLKRGDIIHYKEAYGESGPKIVFDSYHSSSRNVIVQTSDPHRADYWGLDYEYIDKITKFKNEHLPSKL
jgi:hypothetical protein